MEQRRQSHRPYRPYRPYRPGEDGMNEEDNMHNSDDSVTSDSSDRGRAAANIDTATSSPSSSLGAETDTEDTDDTDAAPDDDGIDQDMSFADRVAMETRRSRRHNLLHLARDQSRRATRETTAQPPQHTKAIPQADLEPDPDSEPKASFRRDNKHRPVEMSSKKRVSVLRDATLGLGDGSGLMKKNHVRDPRFDSMAGAYSETAFKKRYSFIFDEKLPEERRELKESLSKIKSDSNASCRRSPSRSRPRRTDESKSPDAKRSCSVTRKPPRARRTSST